MKLGKALLSVFLLFFCLSVFSQRATQSKDSVMVTGSIYNNHDHIKNAVINVYDKNQLIKSIEVRSSNRFTANFPANAFLTIEITAPEFFNKRFIFDTHVPENLKELPKYEFDMDVFSQEELAGVNTSLLDFPIGLVSYNEKKGEFLRNKAYTKKMKKRYLELLDEAMMTDRATE